MYPDSEILFPSRCIPQLRDLRGPEWTELIDHVAALPDGHEDVLGFSLLHVRRPFHRRLQRLRQGACPSG
jgi:hypothetical protein